VERPLAKTQSKEGKAIIGGRKIDDITLPATTTGTGVKLTYVLAPMDLSRAKMLKFNLKVTAAATGATDILDVKVQDTADGVTWNTRVRFNGVAGNQAASVTVPFVQEAALESVIPLQSPEKVYITSGSAGGTELAAGVVMNGPFNPPYREGVTTGTRKSSWRVVFSQTDISTTTSYAANLRIYAHESAVA
jgi:hypothetical protein